MDWVGNYSLSMYLNLMVNIFQFFKDERYCICCICYLKCKYYILFDYFIIVVIMICEVKINNNLGIKR